MAVRHNREEEQDWIERARAGDAHAFAQVVQAYQGPVYNLCYRTLGDPDEAEDATQETFLRVYTRLEQYNPDRLFRNWILTIASNHCIDRLRRRRKQTVSLEDAPPIERTTSENESPETHLEQTERSREIQALLNQLAPNYRLPLVLLYWYEFSYEEIAQALDLSVPAVKSRLHRGRKQLAQLLVQMEDEKPTAGTMQS
ncbi:MAG: sigma-70 family RNA polymerase sigma factor [Chloroflexi bacterium]|nr:sigma-70 family RNA polymerase sigma factor [Chloroflexota bacterium]